MERPGRFGTDDDLDGIWEVFRLGFGIDDAQRDRWLALVDPSRVFLVNGDRGEIAAASNVRSFGQWFGGRCVELGGYSPVAVLPEYRGRGLARAVVTGHYADLRDRGVPAAGLFPSSVALYRSVGFELAGSYLRRRIPAAHFAALTAPPDVVVRRGSRADLAAVIRCYNRTAPRIDGSLRRDEPLWEGRLPLDLAGKVLYVVDHPHDPGEVDGYAVYRTTAGRTGYDYSVTVDEVVADRPDTRRALWRVVGSSGSQAPDVVVVGPAEDPLFLLLGAADPVAVETEIRWMLRLIDAPAAVAARGWHPTVSGRVDLDLVDDHAPWNTGRWRLEVADGQGRLVSGGSGAVRLGIGALATWWAGYHGARALAAAGLVATDDPAALATFDGLGAATPPTLVDFY